MNNALNPTTLAVLGIVLSVLVSSGALLFFFRYGIRLALVEETLKQNNLPVLTAKLLLMEHGTGEMKSDLSDVKKSMAQLNQLGAMHTKVDMIADMVKSQGDRLSALEQRPS